MRNLIVTILACAGAVLAETATADEGFWDDRLDFDLSYLPSATGGQPVGQRTGWDIRLGLGVEREPTYQGSDEYEFEPDPAVLLAYRTPFGTFSLAGEGFGFSTRVGRNLGLAFVLEAEDTREIDDDPDLAGLPDQEEELELEMTAEWLLGPWRVGGQVAVATGDKGSVYFLGGGYTWRFDADRLFVSLDADLSAATSDNLQTDFGITPAQSSASVANYPVYTIDSGGLKSVGLGLTATWALRPNWFLFGEIETERFLGDVVDSPLVEIAGSEIDTEVGIGFYYRFGK